MDWGWGGFRSGKALKRRRGHGVGVMGVQVRSGIDKGREPWISDGGGPGQALIRGGAVAFAQVTVPSRRGEDMRRGTM